MIGVILVGAGRGTRLKRRAYKALVKIGGVELVFHALRRFTGIKGIRHIVVVLPGSQVRVYKPKLARCFPSVRVTAGGRERPDSVAAGLAALDPGCDIVLVHDVARPLVASRVIGRVVRGARRYGACIPVIDVVDTLKTVRGNCIERTLDRTAVRAVQTPQGFSRRILEDAYAQARQEDFQGSDDAVLVERLGCRVRVVEGDEANIKITRPVDIRLAELLLRRT